MENERLLNISPYFNGLRACSESEAKSQSTININHQLNLIISSQQSTSIIKKIRSPPKYSHKYQHHELEAAHIEYSIYLSAYKQYLKNEDDNHYFILHIPHSHNLHLCCCYTIPPRRTNQICPSTNLPPSRPGNGQLPAAPLRP